jgi:uncharacterized membrane protein
VSDPEFRRAFPFRGPGPGGIVDPEELRTTVLVAYGCYALGLVVGITPLIGVIIAYLRRKDAAGTPYASHLSWLITTFWVSLIIGIIGAVTLIILIGWVIWAAGSIWYIYRIVKGGLRALDRQPVP